MSKQQVGVSCGIKPLSKQYGYSNDAAILTEGTAYGLQ